MAAKRISGAPALGISVIPRRIALLLTTGFLLSILIVPVFDLCGPVRTELGSAVLGAGTQTLVGWNSGSSLWTRTTGANEGLMQGFRRIESVIDREGITGRIARPHVLDAFLSMGAGEGNALPGLDHWLFFQPDLRYLWSREFASDPVSPESAIAAFSSALARRGIRLVIVPVPGKPLIHPERFSRAASSLPEPPQNPEWDRFRERLRSACGDAQPILVDPTGLLWERKAEGPQYLRSDTHWQPDAMRAAAERVAQELRAHVPLPPPEAIATPDRLSVTGIGDIARMLRLPDSSPWLSAENVAPRRISKLRGPAPVLLLGDSFSNIYAQTALGWGAEGGFAAELSHALGLPVSTIARNNDGASATRQILADSLRRGEDPLVGVRVVVWEFAMRELVVGRWDLIDLPAPAARTSAPFLEVSENSSRTETATIVEIATMPQPGSSPYKDFLTAAHLILDDGTSALVYFPTMRDHKLTPAAKLRAGAKIPVRIEPWNESSFGSLNRSDIDALALEPPNYGTLLE